jgi:hypothetical protein
MFGSVISVSQFAAGFSVCGHSPSTMIGGIGVVAMNADCDRSPRSVSCIVTAGSSGKRLRLRASEMRKWPG